MIVFEKDFLEKETNMDVLRKIYTRGYESYETWENYLRDEIYTNKKLPLLSNFTNKQLIEMIFKSFKEECENVNKIIDIENRWSFTKFINEVEDYINTFPTKFLSFYKEINYNDLARYIKSRKELAKAWVFITDKKIKNIDSRLKPLFRYDKKDIYDLICRQKPFNGTIFFSGQFFERYKEGTFDDLKDRIDLIFSLFHEIKHTSQDGTIYNFEEYKAYSYLYEIRNWYFKKEVPDEVKNAGENDSKYFSCNGLSEEYEANIFAMKMTRQFLNLNFNFKLRNMNI